MKLKNPKSISLIPDKSHDCISVMCLPSGLVTNTPIEKEAAEIKSSIRVGVWKPLEIDSDYLRRMIRKRLYIDNYKTLMIRWFNDRGMKGLSQLHPSKYLECYKYLRTLKLWKQH